MSWSYQPTGTSGIDAIRRLIGDTIATAPAEERLEDEELDALLRTEGNYKSAAATAARSLAAKLLRKATEKSVGQLRLVYQERGRGLLQLAASLEADVGRTAKPYVGGISVSDKAAVEANTDRVAPSFTVGMLDNSRA